MFTGFFKAKIVAVCPSLEELNTITGDVFEESPVYCYTDKYNKQCSDVVFYILDNQENMYKHTIPLKLITDETKNGAFVWINQIGDRMIAQNEDQLWDSFKYWEQIFTWKKDDKEEDKYFLGAKPGKKEILAPKKYNKAMVGEDKLLHILKVCNNIKNNDLSVNLFLNLESLFKDDFSEIDIPDKNFHAVCFAYVKDGIQKIHDHFFPLEFYNDVLNNMTISQKFKKQYTDFLRSLDYTDGEWELGKIQKFKDEFIKNKKDFTDVDSDY